LTAIKVLLLIQPAARTYRSVGKNRVSELAEHIADLARIVTGLRACDLYGTTTCSSKKLFGATAGHQ
jgi:hypothetical protein